jgi:hypothetical protein
MGKSFLFFFCVVLALAVRRFPLSAVVFIRIRFSLSGSDFLYGSDILSPALLNLAAADAFDVAGEEPVVEEEPAAVAFAVQRSHPL